MEHAGLSSEEVERLVEHEVGVAPSSCAAGRKRTVIVSGVASFAVVVGIALWSHSGFSEPGPSGLELKDNAFVNLNVPWCEKGTNCPLSDWATWKDEPTSGCVFERARFLVQDKGQCGVECDKSGSLVDKKAAYTEVGPGDCDWHYEDGGHDGVQKCAEKCLKEADCHDFTYGDSLGCRYSKCGSDPGPDDCPADKQCPINPHHGGKKYQLTLPFGKIGEGACDWHYKHAKVGKKQCAELCRNEADCKVFTYGDELGCRYSSCGSDPGPDACPADKQCPIAAHYSDSMYRFGPCVKA